MSASHDVMDIFLQPGEHFSGDAGYRVRTILGSCVTITLWNCAKRIGAMCHFLLPSRGMQIKTQAELDGRYADEAIILMVNELATMKVDISQCEAKVFGGGNMFPGHSKGISVGTRNGEAARELLALHGVPVVSESLFGIGHRQVVFDIYTGHVWSRQIKPVNHQIEERDSA